MVIVLLFELFVVDVLYVYVVCCLVCGFWLCVYGWWGVLVALRWFRVGCCGTYAVGWVLDGLFAGYSVFGYLV